MERRREGSGEEEGGRGRVKEMEEGMWWRGEGSGGREGEGGE